MAGRAGEKAGWTWGWIGSFAWVAILAVLFLLRRQWEAGLAGLLLFAMALLAVRVFAPWRHPMEPYWRLLLPLYVLLLLTIPWAIWAFGGLSGSGLNAWMLLFLLPVLMPMATLGKRTWQDGEARDRQ